MERRTASQVRLEMFLEKAEYAKELGEAALADIDHALLEQEKFRDLLEQSGATPEEVDGVLRGNDQTTWTSRDFYL